MRKQANTKLTEAIESKDTEDCRIARHVRNLYGKIVEKVKTEYYKKMLNTDYTLWKTIESKETTTPTEIIHNGKTVTSPRKIAEIMNKEFDKKVKDICENFDD